MLDNNFVFYYLGSTFEAFFQNNSPLYRSSLLVLSIPAFQQPVLLQPTQSSGRGEKCDVSGRYHHKQCRPLQR